MLCFVAAKMSDSDTDNEIQVVTPAANSTGLSESSVSTGPLLHSKRRSPVWGYFTIENADKRDWVTCDLCTVKIKTKDSSTSNLFGHLKRHHAALYAEIAQVSTGNTKSKSKAKPHTASSHQLTIHSMIDAKKPYRKESHEHRSIVKAVTNYLVSGELNKRLEFMIIIWLDSRADAMAPSCAHCKPNICCTVHFISWSLNYELWYTSPSWSCWMYDLWYRLLSSWFLFWARNSKL